ncbi:MAG: DUF1599 domain-containing protein [Bacteroidales bacterium]|nr:DUF1599 domain-containing protein [Bacteroidales bacterium]
MQQANDTSAQFDHCIIISRNVFAKKLEDYGASWRIMRTKSITDQLLIKAMRIRSIEEKKNHKVDEGIHPEFIALVNYSIIALIQLAEKPSYDVNPSVKKVLSLYDKYCNEAKSLMFDKNHDYDEAWRKMRISSYTDLILMKLFRIKQIEDNDGKTQISEGIDANYFDIINYAIFGLIQLELNK